MVSTIAVRDFRNLRGVSVLAPGVNILHGDNAQGKTNFLEAVYLCATGRSHRASADREMIRFGQSEAHVQAVVKNGGSSDCIDVHLKKDAKKGVALNHVPIRKLGDLFGLLIVVMFSPEDLGLVKSGPACRRQFMDIELCQLSKTYYFNLQQYYQALRQRNNLLKTLASSPKQKPELTDTLSVWDEQLAAYGGRIIAKRGGFAERLNQIAGGVHAGLSGQKEKLEITYKPSVTQEDFREKLRKSAEKDMYLGFTSVGVHKDDLQFSVNGSDVRAYGSQGQQRTASLSAKLSEIEIIREHKKESPVLLLDDVLSELDKSRQRLLCGKIEDIQTVITCTGLEDVLRNLPGEVRMMKMADGVAEG
ncbi:MAG: DNA replication/repair protein RecF [Firmicutes bacterium]|nr:DNA replication/repair protein RecF [Bacillota bacterium]